MKLKFYVYMDKMANILTPVCKQVYELYFVVE